MINLWKPPYVFEHSASFMSNKGNVAVTITSDLNKGLMSILSVSDQMQVSAGGAWALQGIAGSPPQGAKFVRITANPHFYAAWGTWSMLSDALAEATIGLMVNDQSGKGVAGDMRPVFAEHAHWLGGDFHTLDSPGLTFPLTATLPIVSPNWGAFVFLIGDVMAAGWKGMGGSSALSYIAVEIPWIGYEYF